MPILPSRFALIELGIFLTVILLEWAWEPFPNLSRLSPHPYWVPVLLLSLQYGTVSGLLAAVMAIGGSVLIGLPEPDIGESYFVYLVRVWTEPILWLIVALMLGSFRMRQIESRDDMLREVDDLQTRSVALVDYATNLKARCDRLERQLASSAKPQAVQLLDELGLLSDATRTTATDALSSFDRLMGIGFPGAQCSLCVVSSDGLKVVHRLGWPPAATWRTVIGNDVLLARAIIGDGRALSLLVAKDEPYLSGECMFAVPISSDDGKSVIGALKIETMPARSIDEQTLARLSAVSVHLGPVLHALISEPAQASAAVSKSATTALARFRWNPFRSESTADLAVADEAAVVSARQRTSRT